MFQVLRFRPGRLWPLPLLMVCLALLPGGGGAAREAAAPAEQTLPPTVYLTFDDGPSANTEALLGVLREYGIRATFFVTGQYEGNTAPLVAAIAREGHSVGLHSYAHRYDEIYRCSQSFFADLQQVEELVQGAVGQQPRLYRFPGGSLNSHCPQWLRQQLKEELSRRGYVYHDWNVVSGDQGSRVLSAEELFQNVVQGAAQVEQGPLVVLFHDTNHCTTTPAAVRLVIEHFLEEGCRFLPITQDTPPIRF